MNARRFKKALGKMETGRPLTHRELLLVARRLVASGEYLYVHVRPQTKPTVEPDTWTKSVQIDDATWYFARFGYMRVTRVCPGYVLSTTS